MEKKKARKHSVLAAFPNVPTNSRFIKNTERKSTKRQQQPAPRICKPAFLNICPTFYQPPDPSSRGGCPYFWAAGGGQTIPKPALPGAPSSPELPMPRLRGRTIWSRRRPKLPTRPPRGGRGGKDGSPIPRRGPAAAASGGALQPPRLPTHAWHSECLGAWV